jgi:putative transposase
VPLAAIITGTQASKTVKATVIKRPSARTVIQNFLADKGYDSDELRSELSKLGFCSHIAYKSNRVKPKQPRRPGRRKARRWVVERIGSWFNKFRRLKTRYERKPENYLAFLMLACALIVFRSI